jgi:serine/threonine-protein kinase ULK/ATG1
MDSRGAATATAGGATVSPQSAAPSVIVSEVDEREGDGPQMVRTTRSCYEKEGKRIARGSFGDVYAAKDLATGCKYAIKELGELQGTNTEDREQESKAREREVDNLSNLMTMKPMPGHIVRLHEVVRGCGPHGLPLLLVMEQCSGSLHDLLREQCNWEAPLPEEASKCLMQQLAQGLHSCRELNIIHRDLKPQNLLLVGTLARGPRRWGILGERAPPTTVSGLVLKIADFGSSRALGGTSSLGRQITCAVGTDKFMAPEVAAGGDYDERADLWSVGIILFELLTRKRYKPEEAGPPWGPARDELEAHPLLRKVSLEARQLLAQLLQRDPAKRCSFDEFFDAKWLGSCAPPPFTPRGKAGWLAIQLGGQHFTRCELLSSWRCCAQMHTCRGTGIQSPLRHACFAVRF